MQEKDQAFILIEALIECGKRHQSFKKQISKQNLLELLLNMVVKQIPHYELDYSNLESEEEQNVQALIRLIGQFIINLSQYPQNVVYEISVKILESQNESIVASGIYILSQVTSFIISGKFYQDFIDLLIPQIPRLIKPQNERIRYSLCNLLGLIIDQDSESTLLAKYQNVLFETLTFLLNDTSPLVTAHSIACISNIFQNINESELLCKGPPFIQNALILLQNKNTHLEVVISIISCLTAAALNSLSVFNNYYAQIRAFIISTLEGDSQNDFRLRDECIQLASIIGLGEEYRAYNFVQALVNLYKQQELHTSLTKVYICAAWERNFSRQLSHIGQYLPGFLHNFMAQKQNIIEALNTANILTDISENELIFPKQEIEAELSLLKLILTNLRKKQTQKIYKQILNYFQYLLFHQQHQSQLKYKIIKLLTRPVITKQCTQAQILHTIQICLSVMAQQTEVQLLLKHCNLIKKVLCKNDISLPEQHIMNFCLLTQQVTKEIRESDENKQSPLDVQVIERLDEITELLIPKPPDLYKQESRNNQVKLAGVFHEKSCSKSNSLQVFKQKVFDSYWDNFQTYRKRNLKQEERTEEEKNYWNGQKYIEL